MWDLSATLGWARPQGPARGSWHLLRQTQVRFQDCALSDLDSSDPAAVQGPPQPFASLEAGQEGPALSPLGVEPQPRPAPVWLGLVRHAFTDSHDLWRRCAHAQANAGPAPCRQSGRWWVGVAALPAVLPSGACLCLEGPSSSSRGPSEAGGCAGLERVQGLAHPSGSLALQPEGQLRHALEPADLPLLWAALAAGAPRSAARGECKCLRALGVCG